jgi:hypothetical protein
MHVGGVRQSSLLAAESWAKLRMTQLNLIESKAF